MGIRRMMVDPERDVLVIVLPILIVLSSLLFLLVVFLICTIFVRRQRSISLSDTDGPVDLSRDEFADGAGGFAGVETRWLENADEAEQRLYQRAKDYQLQHPPNSQPTDITLSQFLSIQEKGVSAWSFDPDYETMPSVLVHARTELTFLPDPLSSCTVQSNLPLPKLNEVYYWEVKLFDLPTTTAVSIGLATKPFPQFRLPGHARFSIGYHSTGDKSYNYPFTSTPFGSPLKEGDVVGVGYRPRTGTVFFTRNGRKTEDAFLGLSKWNLFPSIGADGPCSVHVNLGQAGFVHIEANVKKWGLAPSIGTLAPPPAYGSERGSILLEAGGRRPRERSPPPSIDETPGASSSLTIAASPRRSLRSVRRAAAAAAVNGGTPTTPIQSSPLRGAAVPPSSHVLLPSTISEESTGLLADMGPVVDEVEASSSEERYISPTDTTYYESQQRHGPAASRTPSTASGSLSSGSSLTGGVTLQIAVRRASSPTPSSPEQTLNPPTPHVSDIRLIDMNHAEQISNAANLPTISEPPAYTIVDPARYPNGLAVNIPEDILAAALADHPTAHSS